MGMAVVGTVMSARPIVADDNSYAFYALDLDIGRGTTAACQVWNNDPQYQKLFDGGEVLVNHRVKVSVVNYSIGKRKNKQGEEYSQLRYRVTNVRDLGLPEYESELIGIVKSGRPIFADDKSYSFIAMDINTSRGDTYACQMWDNDPTFVQLGPVVESLVGHKVRVSVVSASIGQRKNKDGSKSDQVRFRITNVRDMGLPPEDEE